MWKFKAEDFHSKSGWQLTFGIGPAAVTLDDAAKYANEKLEMWLAEAQTVYTSGEVVGYWKANPLEGLRFDKNQMQAKLICIECIEPIKRDTAEDKVDEVIDLIEKARKLCKEIINK